ncbi:MAG: hypothetical protein ACREMQ_17020 [Longimicrobiales bacterium]
MKGGTMKAGFAFLATMLFAVTQAPGALAQTPTRQAALDPVGKYDITVEIADQTITSVITVTKQHSGRLAGTMLVHGEEIPFAQVSLENRTLTLDGPNPHGDGTVNMTITFKTNDRFEGTFSMHGSTGPVKGIRIKT